MANDFYKKDGSYYQADTNAKILDLPALQKYATLGGKEIAAPTIQPTTGVGLYKAGVGTTIPNQLSTSNLTSSSTIPPAINSTQAYDEAYAKGLGLGQAQALKDLQAQQEAQKATDQSTLSSSEKAFNDLVAQISGKGKAQADLQASLGVNDMTKQLSDVNAQLAAKTGEFNSLIEQNRNKAINSRIIGGTEDKLVRQKGIETGTLSSIAQAIQGNISTAKQTAEDTIKFQYAPLEQELELKKMQLERAYDTFDASEKKRADQLLATIEAQKEQVTAEKAVKSKINDVMIAASKNGADAQTLKQIMASKDEQEAILAAGSFLAPSDFAVNSKTGQLYNKKTGETVGKSVAKGSGSGSGSGVSISGSSQPDETLLAYARQYASTGTIPTNIPKGSFGQIATLARQLSKPDGTLIDINTGLKQSKVSSAQEEAYTSLYNIIDKLLPQMKSSFQEINTGLLGGVFGGINPSMDRVKYEQLRKEYLNQLLKARSGGAVTEEEYQRYASTLPGTFNNTLFFGAKGEDKLSTLEGLMKDGLDSRLKLNGLSIVGFNPDVKQKELEQAANFDE